MTILESNQDSFVVAVPTNKSDVLREADVIEEILRIYGFNNVEMPAKITTTMAMNLKTFVVLEDTRRAAPWTISV